MKASFLVSLLSFIAAGLSGCDSISYSQYVIRGASLADEKAVAKVVAAAASEAGLNKGTSEPRVPKTLVYYREPVEHFPVFLGARLADADIVVDLSCFHPGPPSSAPTVFKTADALLSKELPKIFGERLDVYPEPHIPFPDQKAPNHSTEPTPASVTRPAGQAARQT